MDTPRKHPDLFTAAEALEYLHLPPDEHARILKTFRDKNWLVGAMVGREMMYHREDLDACVAEIFSKTHVRESGRTKLKLAGGRS